ncbi:SH3 domain-containing protein [Fictibacillus terranigra]|uniref:SH3 domain-containing protein n=1 Tax=Fictibacillus terranigra TaxID=3058424 RepID=A0ABT8EAZ3_9BACL|nr:SH3 domain-containing protein [Fictibacillus sp. CENA-BCM004]MDN4075070.1 SH3 domain-containing protein [Fictibacillus sp. CENA-BCM004]
MKKLAIPGFCFAVLTTAALYQSTHTKPVSAQELKTKYVNVSASSSLNLRKSATTKSAIIAKLVKGNKVIVYSESKGWARLKYNGKYGYVSSKYLITKPSAKTTISAAKPQTAIKYVKVSQGTLNMRKSASSSAAVIAKLAKGTKVTFYSESGGWSKITAGGKTGYVSSAYLSTSNPPAAPNTAKPKTVTKYVMVKSGDTLNLRKSASATSAIVTKLKNGLAVTVYSESKGWAKIKANGKDGYAGSVYLSAKKPVVSASKPAPKPATKYVKVSSSDKLNLRKSPSANAAIITKLVNGLQVTVYSESNGWAKIKANNKNGYVDSSYLSAAKPVPSKPAEPAKTVTKFVKVGINSSLNMRSGPATTYSIMAVLKHNTPVTVHSEAKGWAKVSAGGKTGYVSTSYLAVQAETNPGITNTAYGMTLDEMAAIQMKVNPQTDKKYTTFIRKDALDLSSSTTGVVDGTGWRVRGGAGDQYWVVGNVSNGEKLQIVNTVKGADGYTWYQVIYNKTWVNASPEDVRYLLNVNNFKNDPVKSYQFLKLSQSASLDNSEVNERILAGKGILEGNADAFIEAGKAYGINEIYLISHALLETGNGKSKLATGVVYNGKTVYNMYGIGAVDRDPINMGAKRAYDEGWFTPRAAIIGGAKFISKDYIQAGQDTLYKMRWNPLAASLTGTATHQYATDIGWASKQTTQMYNLYKLLSSYKLILEIPAYKTIGK